MFSTLIRSISDFWEFAQAGVSLGQASVLAARDRCQMEYKQFTVGVLNATLDLAALVLVGVVGFLGSEVVLSPVVSRCLPLSPVVSLHVGGGCWLVWPHLEQKHSEIKITGFNLNLFTVNCLGSTLV